MKKIFLILTIVFAALHISSCNSNKNGNTSSESQNSNAEGKSNNSSNETSSYRNEDRKDVTSLVSKSVNQHLTVQEFDQVINDDKLTMVDFYTTWCGPCKMMAPFVAEIRQELLGSVNVIKVDAEAQLEISQRYNIEAYPTLIFFKKGNIINKQLGATDKEGLMQLINELK